MPSLRGCPFDGWRGSWESTPAYGVFQKPAPRKQLNIGLSEEQYELLLLAAAESVSVNVMAFCRAAILDAALPVEPAADAVQFPNTTTTSCLVGWLDR